MISSKYNTVQTLNSWTSSSSLRPNAVSTTYKSPKGGFKSELVQKFLILAVATSLAVAQPVYDDNFYHIQYPKTNITFEMSCSATINSLNCACPEVNRLYQQYPFDVSSVEHIASDRDAPGRYCCNHQHCCAKYLVVLCRDFPTGGCLRRTRPPTTVIGDC